MLNPTTHELIFIRICIFFLTYAPFFYIFLPPPLSLFALLAELAYFSFFRRFKARLTDNADHPRDTRQERQALFERCLLNIPDPERYLSLWALGADSGHIKRDNVRDFLLWAFFDRNGAQDPRGTEDVEDELQEYLTKTEELLRHPLEPGRGQARHMRLTFDVVPTRYRCLLWYCAVAVVDTATHVRMMWRRFKFYPVSRRTNLLHVFPPRPLPFLQRFKRSSSSDALSYWYRPAAHDSTLPIVFLHGIGIGMYPYVNFLADLPSTSSVLAVEILPISMRLTKTNILAKPDFLSHLKEILRRLEIDRFILVGHSYGTVLSTHVLRDSELGDKVDGVVLVDPVCLLLHLPDVAYNFTRRMPKTANEWQLWYMASMDPGIALVLGRHFFWRENVIWKEELVSRAGSKNRKAAVTLASRDLIVDTLTVGRYLMNEDGLTSLARRQGSADDKKLSESLEKGFANTESGVELLWFHMDHAQAFDKRKDYGRILEVIQRFCIYP